MGTRADFYVGMGKQAEWVGSIAWDGHDDTMMREAASAPIFKASTEQDWREAVSQFLASREDATAPDMGWPWPWDDSNTTDYAYCFDGTETRIFNFGRPVIPGEDYDEREQRPKAEWPDMSERKKVTFGKRSGVMFFGVPR